MNSYQAITTDGQTIDLGQFETLDAARSYAMGLYSGELADVIATPQISVTSEALNPCWIAAGMVALLLLLSNKKRGRNVRK